DGLFERSSGIYIWKNGGYVRCKRLALSESLRGVPDTGPIAMHNLAVRMREQQVEYDIRHDENPRIVRAGGMNSLKDVHIWNDGLGLIFPMDELKWEAAGDTYDLAVSNGEFDGRQVKVLSVALKNLPDALLARYYIDLGRSGQVVRVNRYSSGKALSGWLNV